MRITSASLVSLLLVGLTAVPATAAVQSVRVNVGLTDPADATAVLAGLGERVLSSAPVAGLPALTVEVPAAEADDVITTLTADAAHVRYAEPDGTVHATSELVPSNALTWAKVPEAWTWTAGRADVTVAVVDSGVTANTDLPASRITAGYDFVDDDTDATDSESHGTKVASVIASTRGNAVGVAGVCGVCEIMPVRVLRSDGTKTAVGSIADAAAGIAWAADHGAEVVNVSFSTTTASRLLQDAVEHAASAGSLVVASAGNDISTIRHYPAAYEPALAVTALTSRFSKNTATDHWVDVSAINSTNAVQPDGTTVVFEGSSASAAIVAGVAALAFSIKPDTTAAEVRSSIERTALRHPSLPAYHAPLADAARLVSESGAADTVSPVIKMTTLMDGMVISAAGLQFVATATDDHGIERIEFLTGDRVLGTLYKSGAAVLIKPEPDYNGTLPITVKAYDYAGNVATGKTVTIQVDAVVPTGSFVTPAEEDAWVADQAKVTVATSDDAVRVYSPLGGSLARTYGTNQWTGFVTAADGEVRIVIRDRAGNESTIVRKVRIDAAGPEYSTVEPSADAVVGGTFTTSVLGVTDLSGVATAELLVNDLSVGSVTAAPYSLTVTAGSGSKVLRWLLTDRVGNVTEIRRTVQIDRDGPVATSASPAPGARVRGIFTATIGGVTDTAGSVRAELKVNGRSYGVDTTAPFAFTVPTGTYSGPVNLSWTLTDKLGNTRVYNRQVIADNAGPTVSISKAPKNKAKIKGTTKVYVKASDASGVARVELIVNGKVVARDSTAGYVLAFNASKQKKTMKVQVRAYDKLGNVKYTSTRTWYRR
ncbi:S8 family serine peptidase [Actinoplanes sp. NPDC026670]|uniref:S8 family serine peptidase n=1 Tax=Actinoplanes sp. NPDC026670 TaxID=3154700 RepID=UPI0033EA6EEA